MNKSKPSFWLTTKGLAAIGLIASATYFLLMEHRQHVAQFLPYLILLLCPLMHIFMHRGHDHGSGNQHDHEHQSQSESDAYQRGLEDGRKQSNHHPH